MGERASEKGVLTFQVRCGLVILAILYLCLAISSRVYIKHLDGTYSGNNTVFSLVWTTAMEATHKKGEEVEQLREAYHYLTWPQERARIKQRLIPLLHQQINLVPYEADAWELLSSLEFSGRESETYQLWIFRQLLYRGAWDHSNVYANSYYCLYFDSKLSQLEQQSCRSVYKGLPMHLPVSRIAKRVGVDATVLGQVLARHGLKE